MTIIRSPVDNVESVFGFFQDQMPFEEWLGDVNATDRLKTFYAEPTKYFKRETDWYFRSKNHMFFDIGYVSGRFVVDNNSSAINSGLPAGTGQPQFSYLRHKRSRAG